MPGLEARHLAQQRLSVGMIRLLEQGIGVRAFHDPPEIHDDDTVAQMLHYAQIMADEQVGECQTLAQIHEEIENLRLNGNIQSGYRLVTDDELRLDREGAGDPDPLALTAGELMRIAALEAAIQAAAVQHIVHIVGELRARDDAVDQRCFTDDVGDPHTRIQGREGILKNHLYLERRLPRLRVCRPQNGAASKQDVAFAGLQDSSHHSAQGGLSTAGLTHQTDHLALSDDQIDAVHRLNDLFAYVGA